MERVIRALEHIQTVPGAHVDRGVLQGREAIRAQLSLGRAQPTTDADVDEVSQNIQAYWDEVRAWVAPAVLPKDHQFFLDYCGGLNIDTDPYRFAIHGGGVKVYHWYSYVYDDEDSRYEGGLLYIGLFTVRDQTSPIYGEIVEFYLDLGGSIQTHCVIAVPSWGPTEAVTDFGAILRFPHAHAGCWTKRADSFTEWLELAAETRGTFGYY